MNSPKLKYEFADNGGGEEIGFNDSVTTSFKGHIGYFLARESLQNVIDAAVAFPVRAEFGVMKIPARTLPNPEQLESVFKSCRDYYEDAKAKEFFQKAYDSITQNKRVSILKISDYNTRGLTGGDDDRKGDYYNFLKSSGSSAKEKGTGGSFGLGKGAYFAASSFHTIFVSSVHGNRENVFQGKMRLVTHEIDGIKKQSTGSYGLEGQKPVRDETLIPDFFKRDEKGTDIFVIGFYEDGDWKGQITKSVLNNFWMAILKGILVVKIDGIEINSENIRQLMFQHFTEEDRDTDEMPNPLPAFVAYTDKTHQRIFKKSLDVLGDVELYILPKESYHKKISYFRTTGMEIQKKLHHSLVPYAGVFTCDSDAGNEILRLMENPQHNKWDAHNAREKGEEWFQKAKKADKELKDFVLESLRSLFRTEGATFLPVPDLEKYLYINEEDGDDLQGEEKSEKAFGEFSSIETGSEIGVEDAQENSVEIIKPIKLMKDERKIKKGGKKKTEKRKKKTKKGKGGGSSTDGTDDTSGKAGKVLENIETRAFATSQEGAVWHILIIKGEPSLKMNVGLHVGTEDSFEIPEIRDVQNSLGKKLRSKNNMVYGLELGQDGTCKLSVRFNTNERYALNITAYEDR